MSAKKEFEMSQEDLTWLKGECGKHVPYILIGGVEPDPMQYVNAAWRKLGEKMGFEAMSVVPAPGKGERFFLATPTQQENP